MSHCHSDGNSSALSPVSRIPISDVSPCTPMPSLLRTLLLICSYIIVFSVFFFFSSRRRHTRSTRDWSSDVCSSDLVDSWVAARLRSLPASARPAPVRAAAESLPCLRKWSWSSCGGCASVSVHAQRSEERRVGKECRAGGWAVSAKKKREK